MARTYGDVFGPAFLAEGLNATNAAEVRALLTDQALRDGMVAWMNAIENQGADEVAWKAAFPGASAMSNAQVRTIMRVIAVFGKGEFQP